MLFIENYGGYYVDKRYDENNSDKVIYLTFDAGYENGNVSKILDVLKKENVSAAFFVLDNLIIRNKDLIIRMADEGHLVCNHTSKHLDVTKCTTIDEFRSELKLLENNYELATGRQMPKYFRPPEGKFSQKSMEYASELGYKTIFWSFAYADWDNSSQMSHDAAKEKIMSNIHNGEIMLLHPTSATNAAILGDVICELKALGYRFGTLDELINA
jgi:peptidoglycan-N-acetylmuramic acid deacetylase